MAGYLDFFKDLEVSGIIRNISKQIIAKQALEYPEDIQAYLQDRQEQGLPFPGNFSEKPDQIQQIKQLLNGLYYVEQVFLKLEALPNKKISTILGVSGLLDDAYKGCTYLTQAGADIMSVFQGEIGGATKYFGALQQFVGDYLPASEKAGKYPEYANYVGKAGGHVIAHMAPGKEGVNFDLIGSVTSSIPQSIEKLRQELETYAPTVKQHAPHVNYEKMEELNQRAVELAETMKNSTDIVHAFLNALNLLNQMSKLVSDISQEVDALDESLQRLVLEHVATLKYDILPQLFAFVDKAEVQLMCDRGRLSQPLMIQVKALYEMIISNTRHCVQYEGEAEKLLKLEDERFIACRLAPLETKIRKSKFILHQSSQALESLDLCLHVLINAMARNKTDQEIKAELRESFEFLRPYLTLLDDSLNDKMMLGDATVGNYLWDTVFRTTTNPTADNTKSRLLELRSRLMQMQANEKFNINMNEKMCESVRKRACMTLLPGGADVNPFKIQEDDVLRSRHLLRNEALAFTELGEVGKPENLTPDENWDLYAAYRDRLEEIRHVEHAVDGLLKSCNSRHVFIGQRLKFQDPHYEVFLNQEASVFNPAVMEIQARNQTLRYNLQQGKLEGEGKFYFMSLDEAKSLDYRDCYVFERDQHRLHYIDEEGRVEHSIPYKVADEALEQVRVPEQSYVKQDAVYFKSGRKLTFRLMPVKPAEAHDHAIFLGFHRGYFTYNSYIPSHAGCNLYFSSLKNARSKRRKSCYVWDEAKATLSYIGPDGSSSTDISHGALFDEYLKTLPVHQKRLGFSYMSADRIQTMITAESGHVPMEEHQGIITRTQLKNILPQVLSELPKKILTKLADGHRLTLEERKQLDAIEIGDIQSLLPSIATILIKRGHIGQGPDKKMHLVDDSRTKLRANAVYFKLLDGQLHYHTRTASKQGCNLYFMSLDEARRAGHANCYVWNRHAKQMDYIAPDGRIQRNIKYEDQELKAYLALVHKRYPKANVRFLTREQIKQFITVVSGHSPVEVYQGSLALDQLNCSLKELTDKEQLTPYLSSIFAALHERGHVVDASRSNVINQYATIQPFMMSTDSNVVKQARFDASVVDSFMGMGGKGASVDEFTQRLYEFKAQLPQHQTELEEKLKEFEDNVEGCVLQDSPQVSLRDEAALSADVVAFMSSAAPIERKILDAQKVLFKLNVFLHTKDLTETGYKRCERIQQHQEYLLHHHRQLLATFRKTHTKLDYALPNSLEKTALLYHAPKYKMQVMKDEPPKEGVIQLQIKGDVLHYKLRYYNQVLSGEIPLRAIKPRLAKYNEQTVLRSQTYASIIDNIYKNRVEAIDREPSLLCADEALDLYQWYETQDKKREEAAELFTWWFHEMHGVKPREKYSKEIQDAYIRLQPVLMTMGNLQAMKSMEGAFAYCKQHDISAMFEQQHKEMDEKKSMYGDDAEDLVSESSIRTVLPADPGKVKGTSRKHHLLKHQACSDGLASLEKSLAGLTSYLNPALALQCQKKASSGVPFPEVIDVNHKLEEAHQVLAVKQLSNLVYYLKQVMLELEKMNADETQLAYVTHVVQGYLAVHQAIYLSFDLMEDPYFHRLYQDMIQKTERIYEDVTGKVKHFAPSKKEYQSEVPNLTYALTALYELPSQIKGFREHDTKAVSKPALGARKEANRDAKRIDELAERAPKKVSFVTETNQFFQSLWTPKAHFIINPVKWVVYTVESLALTFASMPIVSETPEITSLLNTLKKKVVRLAHATHDRALADLEVIRTEDMKNLMLAVEALEDRCGLQPGLLMKPVGDVLDQLLLGFMTPLLPMDVCIERMMNRGSLHEERLTNIHARQAVMRDEKLKAEQLYASLQALLKQYHETNTYAMSWEAWDWMPWKKDDASKTLDEQYKKLNAIYKENGALIQETLIANDKSKHFPYLKHRLHGCQMLFMTEQEAKKQQVGDCLLWFYTSTKPPRPKLVYVNSDGGHNEPILLENTFALIQVIEKKAGAKKDKPIDFSGDELTTLITKNHRFEVPANILPFQLTDELMNDLETPLSNPTTHEERENFDKAFKRMLPVMEQCAAYYQGRIATAQTAIEAGNEQIKYLEAEKKQETQANKALRHGIYEEYFSKYVDEALHADRDSVAFYPVGYERDIKDYLSDMKKEYFSPNKVDAVRKGYEHDKAFAKYMNAQVCAWKRMYDHKHVHAYKQLEAVHEAVQEFKAYLVKARSNHASGKSLFESEETILAKEGVIRELEALLTLETSPEERVEEIQEYLLDSEEQHLKILSAYQVQEQQGWNYLKQCLMRLCIACGLKLKVVEQGEALMFKVRHEKQRQELIQQKPSASTSSDTDSNTGTDVTDFESTDEDEPDDRKPDVFPKS